MDKILVTGATGTVGSYVIRSLIERGIHPIAGIRNSSKLHTKLTEQSEIRFLDYNSLSSIDTAIVGIEKIFLVPPMDPDMSRMMKNVLDRLKNIKRIVSISVSGADANSSFPLLRSHGEIKDAIIKTGIPYTFLAPAHFYQNYILFCSKSIQEEACFYFPQGNTKKSMIDCFDIGEIAAKALLEKGHEDNTYNLSGFDYENYELENEFTKVLGKTINYKDVSSEEYRIFLEKNSFPKWTIEIFLKLNAAWKSGSRLKSNEEAIRLLGREPKSFEDFLKKNKEQFI